MSETQEKLQEEKEGSVQQKEEVALKNAGVKIEDNTYKIDLRNAVQEQSADEGVLRTEESEVELQKVDEGNEEPEVITEKEGALELIKEEDELYSKESEKDEKLEIQDEPGQQEEKEQVPEVVLPENIQKLVDFMNETGGGIEDYVRLNADYSKIDESILLKEYYKQTKPHLDSDEIDFLIEDTFDYDEDLDDNKEIKRKKLAYKEEVIKARAFLDDLKNKYYDEVKLNSSTPPEAKEAMEFYKKYSEQQSELTAVQQKQAEQFTKATNDVFNEEFKGFEFKIGENKYRFKVNDVQQTKKVQSNLIESFRMFLDDQNMLKDPGGYHKALFAARNADSIANHFYEQGKSDAIRQLEADSKNINMDPRKTSNGMIDASGIKVRAISGDDSSKLRIKIGK